MEEITGYNQTESQHIITPTRLYVLTHTQWRIQNFACFFKDPMLAMNAQNTLRSRLEGLTVQKYDTQSHQNHLSEKLFQRHQIFSQIQFKFFQKLNFNYTEIDQILNKYFTFSPNPIYEKTSKLPMRIFVCGYCKQPFFHQSHYLKHCYLEQCAVNHDRSTFYFRQKHKPQLINNRILEQTLTSKQLQTLVNTPYEKKNFLFSDYDLIKSEFKKKSQLIQCPKCFQFVRLEPIFYFKRHFILECKKQKESKADQIFKVKYHDQNSINFVNDIQNFYLNFNILAISNHSYIRFTENSNSKLINQNHKFYCEPCSKHFNAQLQYLQHSIFQCKHKFSEKSSHIFNIKETPTVKKINYKQKRKVQRLATLGQKNQSIDQQQSVGIKMSQKIKQGLVQENLKGQIQQELKIYTEQINHKYKNLSDLLKGVYLCGQCLNFFDTAEKYFAHCLIYLCRLNHPRSSYKFLQVQRKTPLKIEDIQDKIRASSMQFLLVDQSFLKRMKYILIDKRTNKIEENSLGNYKCGKCSQIKKRKYHFINHVLRVCVCPKNEKNSHQIQVLQEKLSEKILQKFVVSLLFGIQIMRHSPGVIYRLWRHTGIQIQSEYCCGNCQSLFDNIYEFIFHSLLVCDSLKNKNSSHNVKLIKSSDISHPLEVIEQVGQSGQLINFCFSFIQNKKRKTIQTIEIEQKQGKKEEKQKQEKSNIRISHDQIKSQQLIQDIEAQDHSNTHLRPSNAIQSENVPKVLRPNIDFMYHTEKKFFCAKCNQTFKRKQTFVTHLETCKEFQNVNSSHFYISNERQIFINRLTAMSKIKKNSSMIEKYPEYKIKKDETFICGCGWSGEVSKYIAHIKSNHDLEMVEGSSHIELRVLLGLNRILIILPVNLKPTNPNFCFNCPCKPWKKYSYDSFVKHVTKRHQNKTPTFHMRKPSDELSEVMGHKRNKQNSEHQIII